MSLESVVRFRVLDEHTVAKALPLEAAPLGCGYFSRRNDLVKTGQELAA